jgi:uncharacterized protein YjbI with pentapeptide repeats
MEAANAAEHDLEDEATFRRLEFGLDLAGRSAGSVEFEQCRFAGADLGGTSLDRATFRDCVFAGANLANLRTERSAMLRARLDSVRMTGLHWVGGTLEDVVVSQCRVDLSSFRFTVLRRVVFEGCNLTGADFQNADLTGVQFRDCDLTRAQFSQATMEGARFARCTLLDIAGVTSFAGAIIAYHDLVVLSHTLAGALGIRIETAEDEG